MHPREAGYLVYRRWEMVGLLWLAYFLNQGDRQIFGVTLPLIRGEFHLSDTQMGLVATVFSIVFGLFVPVAGWLGDRLRRDAVVIASLLIFSLGTLLTGLATAFLPLLIFRGIATGMGEALYAPAANSLVADYHVETRARALALHQTANYTGVVVGSFLAGLVADHFGWRAAFAVFGGVGLVWSLVIWLRTREHQPVLAAAPAQKLLLLEAFGLILRTPALIAQTIGFSGLVFVLVGYLTWTPSLLAERFQLSLAQSGLQSVAWHHLLAYVGLLSMGVATDHFVARWPRMRLISMGCALVLFAPFLFISSITMSQTVMYLSLAAFGFFRGVYDTGLYAAIFDHVENRLRASVSGIIVAVAYVVASLSPVIMGALRAHYGLQAGMQVLAGGALAAGLIFPFYHFGEWEDWHCMSSFTGIEGRKALITGSVTGIGRAIAEALAREGSGIVAHGLDGHEVRRVADQWRTQGYDVCESDADLTEPNGAAQLKRHLGGWGTPDILVLNASIEIAETWEQVSLDALEKQGMVNIWSSLLLVQAFLPDMLAREWGRFLAIGSIQECRPNARHIAYAATKAAQSNMILNLARNVRAQNVTFNVLKPGVIATNRNAATLSDVGRHHEIERATPLGRIGMPDDCVGAALLLCSDEGRYINGAELHVDGGYRL